MNNRVCVVTCFLTLTLSSIATADLFMRVVDNGSGLCCVIRTHNGKNIVYDLGHWNGDGYRAFKGVESVVPDDESISLLVVSHSDSDHLGGAKRVFDEYQIDKVVHSGFDRDTGSWDELENAIADEADCEEINLKDDELPDPVVFDDTTITFVAGWHQPPDLWGLSGGEYRNGGSICIRVEYSGKSILLCGDAVGRHKGDHSSVCIATEKFMCDHVDDVPIDSDVIVAPHHGADNGSSTRFIQAVSPQWVIFSAGHAHQHPTYAAAKRYMDNGVSRDNIFRTDLGDHEDGPYEWWHGRIDDNKDRPGDDDVDVRIKPSGFVLVKYRHDNSLSFSDLSAAPWNEGVPQDVLEQEGLSEEELLKMEYGEDYIDDHAWIAPLSASGTPQKLVQPCPRPLTKADMRKWRRYWRRQCR